MDRKVLIDPTFSPLTVFFNQMKQHVTMIVCDKTAFKWGSPGIRGFLTTCEPVAFCLFSDPESVPDVHQIRDCVSAGSARLRMSGLKNPGSSNSNNTLKDALLNMFNLTFVRLGIIASLPDHSDSE